ncbi:MAG: hypothetical protein ACLQGV_13180 [Bryobacteraceae bacterium]
MRKVVGYRRYDTLGELRLPNQIYAVLRLYKNFFLPTIKLKSKTRVGGRIQRRYDKPLTPYERLMKSRQIDRQTKKELRSVYESLNPAELHRQLTALRQQLEQISAAKGELARKPTRHGPSIELGRRRHITVSGT